MKKKIKPKMLSIQETLKIENKKNILVFILLFIGMLYFGGIFYGISDMNNECEKYNGTKWTGILLVSDGHSYGDCDYESINAINKGFGLQAIKGNNSITHNWTNEESNLYYVFWSGEDDKMYFGGNDYVLLKDIQVSGIMFLAWVIAPILGLLIIWVGFHLCLYKKNKPNKIIAKANKLNQVILSLLTVCFVGLIFEGTHILWQFKEFWVIKMICLSIIGLSLYNYIKKELNKKEVKTNAKKSNKKESN